MNVMAANEMFSNTANTFRPFEPTPRLSSQRKKKEKRSAWKEKEKKAKRNFSNRDNYKNSNFSLNIFSFLLQSERNIKGSFAARFRACQSSGKKTNKESLLRQIKVISNLEQQTTMTGRSDDESKLFTFFPLLLVWSFFAQFSLSLPFNFYLDLGCWFSSSRRCWHLSLKIVFHSRLVFFSSRRQRENSQASSQQLVIFCWALMSLSRSEVKSSEWKKSWNCFLLQLIFFCCWLLCFPIKEESMKTTNKKVLCSSSPPSEQSQFARNHRSRSLLEINGKRLKFASRKLDFFFKTLSKKKKLWASPQSVFRLSSLLSSSAVSAIIIWKEFIAQRTKSPRVRNENCARLQEIKLKCKKRENCSEKLLLKFIFCCYHLSW